MACRPGRGRGCRLAGGAARPAPRVPSGYAEYDPKNAGARVRAAPGAAPRATLSARETDYPCWAGCLPRQNVRGASPKRRTR